jgi:hypothetical protein
VCAIVLAAAAATAPAAPARGGPPPGSDAQRASATRAASPARALSDRGGPAASHARRIVVNLARALASFSPETALGAALDGHEEGETAQIYTSPNERAMESAGLGPVDYRLRTELGVAAWHWNPIGSWSDAAGHKGYWTSSPAPGQPFPASYGYDLPRRGDTLDQANDTGYSRLDDGSLQTFWKSNPYLDPHYTREPHPQWVLVDFRSHRPIDAVRIAWGQPYAKRFKVQWWQGPEALLQAGHAPGRWRDFTRAPGAGTLGAARARPGVAGHPGVQTLALSRGVSTRFLRILLLDGSGTAPRGSHDIRDRLGYAVRELYVGRLERGRFVDLMRHGVRRQTVTYASSTDPWHAASDVNRNYEQPSFTTVVRSGLTRGLPLLVGVPVLYGIPEDAVAELRYLRALKVPIAGVELGEEPNGQYASPEDYGALYVQFARAIHDYDPTLLLGGPGYETSIPDFLAWPDAHGDRSWTRRFLAYLRAHEALDQLGFFSFEWYPFDNGCRPVGPQLARAAGILAEVMHRQTLEGLPSKIPRIITEFGYSAFATRDEVDLSGAVLDADIAAQFLALGGARAYLYGYEPSQLMTEPPQCNTWGNLTLLQSDSRRRVKAPVAAYWTTRMLTQSWMEPGPRPNTLLATSASGAAPVAAYALRRPDGSLAILLLNKDPRRARAVSIAVTGEGATLPLTGRMTVQQLSSAQYLWHAAGERSYARPDGPPAQATVDAGPHSALTLPPLSITVLRG